MSKAPADLPAIASLLVNVRFRDQSLKVAQFTMKFLHPFLYRNMSAFTSVKDDENFDIILHLCQMISNGRKAFRLLKSINHISKIYTACGQITHTMEEFIVKILTIFEEFCWSIFYVLDHQLFFFRTKLIICDENTLLKRFSTAWFTACMTAFIKTLYQIYLCQKQEAHLLIERGILSKQNSASTMATCSLIDVNNQLADLNIVKKSLHWKFVKSLLDIGVSGSYPALPVWSTLTGLVIGDEFTGLCGVISACMAIYEVWPDAAGGAVEPIEVQKFKSKLSPENLQVLRTGQIMELQEGKSTSTEGNSDELEEEFCS